ncbi:MAG: phosphoribosylglycinamide formyltransferase [Chitinophagales bacterium]|nr:phosphoribosylglycinamide formyltransferase [Chitinophagales bacterium]HRN93865.1 phosphoribosylglycinamide formyltransferase [Chitinophagales bacterium]HRP38532.1 phosphoribosylglycinamide formyltransferase [Chitinophagales bacterium]
MKKVAVFASGTGSNAKNIIEHFNGRNSSIAKVELVVCNKENAGVLQHAANAGVESVVITKQQLNDELFMLELMQKHQIDFIVLAGFLLLIPKFLAEKYHRSIINIHPALLPKYGGKGMYGSFVHQAVWENREKETGITIHFVNEKYDEGDIIFQAKAAIENNDTPTIIAKKVQQLEHQYFVSEIEKLLIKK